MIQQTPPQIHPLFANGSGMRKPKGVFILDASAYNMVYGTQEREEIASKVDIIAPAMTADAVRRSPGILREVEVIFSGWGGPQLTEEFLDDAPRLRALFYAAGSASSVLTPSAWARGVQVTTAYAANAVPVAEYALATILFSLKHGWALSRQTHRERRYPARDGAPGCYNTTVGLVSLGMIARTLVKKLRNFDLNILAHDPFLSPAEAAELGVEAVSMDELFSRSNVVSLHAPFLAETRGLITGAHFARMRKGATFINTARGQCVREAEMIAVLRSRPDLWAVLDVTHDEPPRPECELYDLPNVVLTPHMAGSVGDECRRLGRYMVEELERYLKGEPLQWLVTPELAEASSHRPLSVTVAKPQRREMPQMSTSTAN